MFYNIFLTKYYKCQINYGTLYLIKYDLIINFYNIFYNGGNNIIENLDKLAKLARQKEKENREFIIHLKRCDHYEVDKTVHQLSKKYLEQYDCTSCANCCKKLTPSLTHSEITKIADHLKLSYEEFTKKYVEKEIPGGFILKGQECPFIENNKCDVYECRPETCASFPHLNKDHINNRLLTIIDNSYICPIIYEVIEELKNIFW